MNSSNGKKFKNANIHCIFGQHLQQPSCYNNLSVVWYLTIPEFIIIHIVQLNTFKINALKDIIPILLFQIVFLGSMQRDVKRSVETANLEYYATLQLGVVQMDVWIIGYLRIVQVLTVNPIDEYVMQYIDTENIGLNVFYVSFCSTG